MRVGSAVILCVMFIGGSRAATQFEVASVRRNENCEGAGRGGGRPSPGRVTLQCAELRDLVLTAYGIYANGKSADPQGFRMQVRGGPAWIDSERYDIAAKAEGKPALPELYGPMLRALLEDRFQLKVHRETKEVPVYFLTAASKDGLRLQAAKDRNCAAAKCENPVTGSEGTLDVFGATMADFATQLSLRLDRDVVDKTGIAGRFDFHLQAAPADLALRAVAGREVREAGPATPLVGNDAAGPSIFTALKQQLGLRLESGKGPVDSLVIDSMERPSGN